MERRVLRILVDEVRLSSATFTRRPSTRPFEYRVARGAIQKAWQTKFKWKLRSINCSKDLVSLVPRGQSPFFIKTYPLGLPHCPGRHKFPMF